jgi:quercetin dioxygenase-like cupin family protein
MSLGYGIVRREDADWSQTRPGSFAFRDLGLSAASGGRLGAVHLRSTPDYAPEWFASDLDFELVYVLSGSALMEGLDGSTRTLAVGDGMILPPRWPHRGAQPTADFEAVVITSPAVYEVVAGREGAAPTASRPQYTSDSPGSYAACLDAPEFRCRDLGAGEASAGCVGARISQATTAGAATGWRYRTASQWLLVLAGHGSVELQADPAELQIGDAVSIGAGPSARHRLGPCSADYAALELFLPAAFETVAG